MFSLDRRRTRPSLLSYLGLALAGLCLAACSTTTQGSARLVSQGVTQPPVGAFSFCLEEPEACGLPTQQIESLSKDSSKSASDPVAAQDETAPTHPAVLTDLQLFAMARVINASVNTAISYRSDALTWNTEERWVLPLSAEGVNYGDCEDYALEKRAALLAAGAPSDRLRMATAWSPGTGVHAVLILRLEDGDYVLDSTTPHILNVAQTRYEWRSLQSGPSLLEWSQVSTSPLLASAQSYTAG